MASKVGAVGDITRRAALGALGVGVVGVTAASWPRLTAADIPGRGDNSLSIVIQGTKADAAAREKLVADFNKVHPDIKVKVQAIQSVDWKDFFVKLLTMVAAGQSPDLVYVATEGTQLFAERLAEPLDRFVQRDAADLQEYFDDVHPSLVEAMMYKGSLYQLPLDWNAANMYFNTSALNKAGLELPPDDWSHLDFRDMLTSMKQANGSDFTPYYWTNRLFGGVVPWLYINDTSFLKETKATGGRWLWDGFYKNDPSSKMRAGGSLWESSNALDSRVEESFDFLRGLVKDGLGVRPEEGGGNSLVGLFASGRIGSTPAGGYWVEGLHEAGMKEDQFDVAFFPKWRTQRHQFGTAGYAIMKTAKDKDAAWEFVKWAASKPAMEVAFSLPTTTPTRRSMVNEALYSGKGPGHWKVFYDTLDKFPSTGPIPAPPQQAAVETALIKNVSLAVSGDQAQLKNAMKSLERDLDLALGRN